jgi:hypothetical protein
VRLLIFQLKYFPDVIQLLHSYFPWGDGKTKVLKLKVDLERSAGGRCSQVPKYKSSKLKYKFKIKKNNYGVIVLRVSIYPVHLKLNILS